MHPAYNYIKQAINGQYPDTEASAIAKAILTDVFQLSTTDLYASKDMNFSTNQAEKLEVIINRLRANEPLQYILGNCYFCGLDFHVEPGVLIPRPETAELVEWIISDRKSSDSPIRILDIGTGSGCISISLAKNLPRMGYFGRCHQNSLRQRQQTRCERKIPTDRCTWTSAYKYHDERHRQQSSLYSRSGTY